MKQQNSKPTKPCCICGSNDWWQRPDGGWLCNKCHPNPKKKKPWQDDAKWALEMQPFAIAQFYSKLWPGARIIELDKEKENELARAIDIGGADKMIQFPDGGLAFLGQRFRRPHQKRYDDFTLRRDRPSGMMTEFQKIVLALQRGGFLAGYYAYGHVNEEEDGFIRMRILRFREFIEAVLYGELQLGVGRNPNGSSTWFKIPFRTIPARFFLLDYAKDKPQHKLSL